MHLMECTACFFNPYSGQATQRHPEYPPYCCFFSDLTGFEGFRRAGPTRSAASIPYHFNNVNVLLFAANLTLPQ